MTGDNIERWGGRAGRSAATAWNGMVFAVATAGAPDVPVAEQTRRALAIIDRNLAEAGTDRSRLLSVTVYLADIGTKAEMDAVWTDWVGPDPAHWPQRACVQAGLAPNTRVEITVVAARG